MYDYRKDIPWDSVTQTEQTTPATPDHAPQIMDFPFEYGSHIPWE